MRNEIGISVARGLDAPNFIKNIIIISYHFSFFLEKYINLFLYFCCYFEFGINK